jgi:hypothetical protein
MFEEIFNVKRSLDHWYWKYRDNPFGSFNIAVAQIDDGEMAAHYAGYPVPFYFYKSDTTIHTLTSYQIGDKMSRPKYRNIGFGKSSILFRTADHFFSKFCDGKVPFIYGSPTENSLKLALLMDCKPHGVISLWKKDLRVNLLDRIISIFFNYHNLTIDKVTSITEEWDQFFNEVGPHYIFMVKRDAKYLKWRYIDCPDKIYHFFSLRKKGKLIGWGVFKTKGNTLVWGDTLFSNKNESIVSYFLSRVVYKYFQGVKSIEGWFSNRPEWWTKELFKAGFKNMAEPNNITLIYKKFCLNNHAACLFEEKKIKKSLYYTMGDTDLF